MFSHRSGRSREPHALAALVANSPPPRFDLCGSNPTRAGIDFPAELLESVKRATARSQVYRPEPFGLLPAREAVARFWAASRGLDEPPPAEHVLLTASTSEAYSFLFKLLCDAGDEILVPAPSYPLFEHLAELEAVRVVPYRLAYDGAWHIDFDSLRRSVTARSRAVIVVSPNNPTGQYLTAEELECLAGLGLPIVSDEVFFEYPLRDVGPERLALRELLMFRLGGLSKLVGAPQLKLAWTVASGPERLLREACGRLELIADTFLSVGTPVQLAAAELLELVPSVSPIIGSRCRENVEVLLQLTRASPVTLLRAEGGWSAVLRLPSVSSEDDIVVGLLRDEGVLVQPGWFYDFESPTFVVLSLLTEPRTFREAAERLVAYVTRTSA